MGSKKLKITVDTPKSEDKDIEFEIINDGEEDITIDIEVGEDSDDKQEFVFSADFYEIAKQIMGTPKGGKQKK